MNFFYFLKRSISLGYNDIHDDDKNKDDGVEMHEDDDEDNAQDDNDGDNDVFGC